MLMLRSLRGILGVSFAALACVVMFSAIGCGGGGDTTCTTDANCSADQKCDTTAGKCVAKGTTPGCTGDTDCGTDGTKVCDSSAGKNGTCFEKCTDDTSCAEGNTCDATTTRCKCDATACGARDGGGKYGCHPVTDQCEVYCTDDTQCDSAKSEKCVGADGKKHCVNESEVKNECTADADCGTGKKCDTAALPKKCVDAGPASCKADTDCTADATKALCDTATGNCVACLDDTDCAGAGEKCDVDGTCKAPTACTTTKACNDSDKSSYCPAGGDKPCTQATLDCTADNKATGNSAWTENIKDGKGMIVWNAQARVLTDAVSCWDLPSGAASCQDDSECGADENCSGLSKKCLPTCSTNDDCDSGSACNADAGNLQGKKACVVPVADGTVELKFNFYSSGGKFKSGKQDNNDRFVMLAPGSDGKSPGIATQVTIESGDATEGVGQFSYCAKSTAGNSYSFYINDTDGNPSNSACYTPAKN